MDRDLEMESEMEAGAEICTDSPINAEPELPGIAADIAGPRIAITMDEARTLLSLWEAAVEESTDEPVSLHASADFFLPYLAANDCYLAPHVALWETSGVPSGILIARITFARPRRAIGPLAVPMPRLNTLEIVHGGLAADTEATAQLQLEYLRDILASGEVDAVSIHHLPCDSEVGKHMAAGLRRTGDGNPEITSHWYMRLTDTSGNPVVSNSAKTRSSFRRKDRKLVALFQGRIHIRELNTIQEVTPLISAASGIGERSYQGGLGVGVRNDTHWHTILNILAANGYLRGYLLQADGVNVAYGVGGVCRGTFCYMAGSFLPEYREIAPGGYLLRRIFERLQNEGIHWFDFGFGDATYKELHGNLHREEATFHLYGTSRTAQTARVLDGLVRWSNRSVRRLLASTGTLERARRHWRRLLERNKR